MEVAIVCFIISGIMNIISASQYNWRVSLANYIITWIALIMVLVAWEVKV